MKNIISIVVELILCGTIIISSSSVFCFDVNIAVDEEMIETIDETAVDNEEDNLEILTGSPLPLSTTNNLYLSQYYSTHYFYKLNTNYGDNYIGSCSYVSLAMLLSYYDTYWDDTLIEECYDEPTNLLISTPYLTAFSPGIKSEESLTEAKEKSLGIYNIRKLTYSEYYSVVENNISDYFHCKLISMGKVPSIYMLYQFFDVNPYGLGLNGRIALLEKYLYEYMDFSEEEITYEYVTTDVENYIIDKVSQGIPVLIAVGFPDGTGHAFIVYDYDSNTGTIYGHVGWNSWETHVDISTLGFSYYKNAMILKINSDHSCSNNYISSNGNTTYCSCYFSCHPEHICTYGVYDDIQHIYTCDCVNNTINTSNHEYEYVVVDNMYHMEKCKCGVTKDKEGHIYTTYEDDNYAKCKYCNYLKYLGGTFVPVIKNKKVIVQPICIE